jgi:tricorn protease-like protein
MFPAPVNSKALDFCPFYDKETKVLYFTSDRIAKKRAFDERFDFDAFLEESKTYPNGQSRIFKVNIQDIVTGR